MVNLSKGLDKVLKAQGKISREIKLIRRLQEKQLVRRHVISSTIFRL
jgi:hypothetical protein